MDLYKRLPKKNCGRCRQKTCMPFALAVISGSADTSECPLLSKDEALDIKGSLTGGDWKYGFIEKLKKEVALIDLSSIASDLGAHMTAEGLSLKCFGREMTVSADGEVTSNQPVDLWLQILILNYLRSGGKGLSGKWAAFSELKSGIVKAKSFERECEEPLRELFDRDAMRCGEILLQMGAKSRADLNASQAWETTLLPMVTVVIIYWAQEDEFPSKLQILFDSAVHRFLDVESLTFLIEGLVKLIEEQF